MMPLESLKMSRYKLNDLHLFVQKCAFLAHLRAFFSNSHQVSFSYVSKIKMPLFKVTDMNGSFPDARYWSKVTGLNGNITLHQAAF